ncbi:FAD-dependent oxidoreductase [Aspergillus stella-maris]|uniref:FAD-dependent oxidoreductase n=1 Tax=Aspergillus stella-maris TaxID=1810926 RepID=UPI003CCD6D90
MTLENMSSPSRSRVLIIGAGAFGLSTALYLQRYHQDQVNVTLLDSQPFPSIDSASGNDTSRQIRMDYADPFYAKLAKEAIHAWRTDPVFAKHYNECGRVAAAAPVQKAFLDKCRQTMKEMGVEIQEYAGNKNKAQLLKKRFPMLGNVEGWDFYFNPQAGYANPREALIAAMDEYRALDGIFIGDTERGYVTENILEDNPKGPGPRVVGVRTAGGHVYYADHIIYAIGALTTMNKSLIPELDTQIYPTGFAIAHWKLDDPKELEAWRDHPAVDIYHHGYFFPPDPSTGLMKLGLGIIGFKHEREAEAGVPGERVGIARANSSLVDTADDGRIPPVAEDGIRHLLSCWSPTLAEKKFLDMKICWDAMTPDGGWLIDHHPDIWGLSIATGGSGHGFKFLPVVGGFIAQALRIVSMPNDDSARRQELRSKWRWGRETNLNAPDHRVVLQGRPVLNVLDYLRPEKRAIEKFLRPKL